MTPLTGSKRWWTAWPELARAFRSGQSVDWHRWQSRGAPVESLTSHDWTSSEIATLLEADRLLLNFGLSQGKAVYREGMLSRLSGSGEPWDSLRKLAVAALEAREHGWTEPHVSAPPARSPIKPVPVSTLAARPQEISRVRELAVPNAREFGGNGGTLSIYADESYSPEYYGIGVLAGIAWWGPQPNYQVLPAIENHLRDQGEVGRLKMMGYFNQSLCCKRCLPFFFVCDLGVSNPSVHYEAMVAAGLRALLGWVLNGLLLPGQQKTEIRVVLASREDRGFGDGTVQTDWLRGVLHEALQNPDGRFSRWILSELTWAQPETEYVSWGDLMGYSVMSTGRYSIANWADAQSLPGYVPATRDIVRMLTETDAFAQTRNPRPAIDLLSQLGGCRFGEVICGDLQRSIGDSEAARLSLLSELDLRYRAGDRNLSALNQLFEILRPIFPAFPEKSGIRTQLAWALVELQRANHFGDPDGVISGFERFQKVAEKALREDAALAVVLHCVLAVHLSDRFEFQAAGQLLDMLTGRPGFQDLIPPRILGIVRSNRGQVFSMSGDFDLAEICFEEALALFRTADIPEPERQREISQTGVYRAINAVDAGFREAWTRVEEMTGSVLFAAERYARDGDGAGIWKHHLLLRSALLIEDGSALKVRDRYYQLRSEWLLGDHHPWELIEFYRALLLFEAGEHENAAACFRSAIGIATEGHHGGTLALIGATIAAVGNGLFPGHFRDLAEQSLRSVGPLQESPYGRPAIAAIRQSIASTPVSWRSILDVLPFNYR